MFSIIIPTLNNLKYLSFCISSLKKNSENNNEIIISATLVLNHEEPGKIAKTMSSIINYRKLTQPASSKNAGSIFKNHHDFTAGELIEKSGLKGYRYGGASVSEIHANFIVNDNNASARDVAALMLEIQSRVYKSAGIFLEPEVEEEPAPEIDEPVAG